eukprot:UN10427
MLTAVVTGASSGIGELTVRTLLGDKTNKWRVVMIARRVNRMREIAKSCIGDDQYELNKRIKIIGCDLYESKSVKTNVIPAIKSFTNCVDLLINNAGNPFVCTPIDKIDLKAMQKDINLYLLTPFVFIKYLENELATSKYPASIITISGIAAQNVVPKWIGYTIAARASKALTQNFAIHYGEQYGIRVNGIDCGVIDSGIFEKNHDSKKEVEEFMSSMVDLTPLKKIGSMKDVVEMIMFLSDPINHHLLLDSI